MYSHRFGWYYPSRRPNPPYFSPNGRNWSRSIKDTTSDFVRLIEIVSRDGFVKSRNDFWDEVRGKDHHHGPGWGSSFWTGVINSKLLTYDRSRRMYVKGPEWKYWVSKVQFHNPNWRVTV